MTSELCGSPVLLSLELQGLQNAAPGCLRTFLREASSEPAMKGSSSLSPLTLFCLTTVPVAPNTCCLFSPQRTVGAMATATHDRHTANVESEWPPQLRGSVPGTSEFSTGFVGTSGLDPRWALWLRRGSCSRLMRPRHVMGQVLEGVGQR